ncbi:glycerol-3-phosphate dehydrogenase [NAD(+)], cytoplasmic-like [Macrosteles quadrilineatus]|uniref:glycerol-3-phosphate dehydrogenase [NAD(+)], cytoplasmic-like n=1 Tax=Macrosteles quadrilineatus TaxID=74068 RepID=UPI0023E2ABB9|nr:glycerol-3-phosphate dehydrogenase [NAD(+)], cytoplasmic-like [Macrosteles quadrilineatus]
MDDNRKEKKVCVVGSGNQGTALAAIIAANCIKLSGYQNEVNMYVYEEEIDGKKLTEIINETHENVKYLPGKTLGSVVAIADLVTAAKEADFIVFAVPHNQIKTVCAALLGKIKKSAFGVVAIKGFVLTDNNTLEPASKVISNLLKIQTCVLTGFAFPNEVVSGKLCETTIGCKSKAMGVVLSDLLQSETLSVVLMEDVDVVEVLATLRTLVGCAAGFVDGLGQKYNWKAAIFRIGLIEMVKFLDLFYPHIKLSSVFESSSIADLLVSCYYGQERRVSEGMARTGMTLGEAERHLLDGRGLGGARVARDVYHFLRHREVEEFFPLFTAVHRVFTGELRPKEFLMCIHSHPEHGLRLQRIVW